MTTENIIINVNQNGAPQVTVQITAIANASANAARQVNFFQQAIGRLTLAYAAKQFFEMADAITLMEGKLKLATKSNEDYATSLESIYRVSQANNVGIMETAKLYTRLIEPIRKMGGGMKEVAGISEAFAMTLRVSSASTNEAAAATLQFSQAMNKGYLNGDEFRTLVETNPRLMRAMAEGMGVATGELKGMATQGQLTSEVISNALLKQIKILREETAGLAQTVGGAFSDLKNDTYIAVGAFDDLTGASAKASGFIQSMSYLAFALGRVFKDEVSDGTDSASRSFDNMTPIVTGVAWIIEKLLIGLSNVSNEFQRVGRYMGAVGATATQLANGEFSQIGNTWSSLMEDGDLAAASLKKYQERVSTISDTMLKMRRDAKDGKASVMFEDYGDLKSPVNEKDLIDIRMRLSGVTNSYFKDLNLLQKAYETGAISQKEYVATVEELATKTYNASVTGKAARKELNAPGQDDRMKRMQEDLVKQQSVFETEQTIFENRNRMLDTFHTKFNMSDSEYYTGRLAARQEFIDAEKTSFAKEVAILNSFKPKNDQEVAAARVRYQKLLAEHQDFNNKMAGLRTDDLLEQMGMQRQVQQQSDEAVGNYLSSQYQTLEALKTETMAREESRAAVERQNVAIYEQALANMQLQASLPVGPERTQAEQDHAKSMVEFLTAELNFRKGITSELEKQEGMKLDRKSANDAIKMWKDAGKDIAESLSSAFGSAGKALGDMLKSYGDGVAEQLEISKRLAAATRGMVDDDPRKVKAVADAKAQSAKAQIKSYGDMAGAAKGFFKENTKGYQTLETVERGFRAFEFAMQMKSLFTHMFVTTNKATATVAGQATETAAVGAGEAARNALKVPGVFMSFMSALGPFGAAAAAVAIAAVLGGGFSGKSVNVAEQRQKSQGTGTVLGDKDAKSESIARSLELAAANSNIELNYTAGMLRSLRNIESSMSGLTSVLSRGSGLSGDYTPDSKGSAYKNASVALLGGGLGVGLDKLLGGKLSETINKIMPKFLSNAIGKVGNYLFGGNVTTLDTGLSANKGSLGSVLGGGLKANQYTDTKKDGGIFSKDKYNTANRGLGAEANQQFTAVIANIATSITQAADMLGVGGRDFEAKLKTFVVDIGKISLKGLTGEQVQKQLEAVFSKLGDDMARFAVGNVAEFQKVGEGYMETLVRVATNYANLDSIMSAIGRTFGATGVSSLAARERLIDLAGGIDELAAQTASFADQFLTDAERLAPVQKYVTDQLAAMGLSGIDTRDKFKQVVMGLDVTTLAGAEQYTAMMALADSFAKVHAAAQDVTKSNQQIADERKSLQDKLDELTMSSAQLRAKERRTIDTSNQALYDQITAREDLNTAYENSSNALKSTIERVGEFQKSITSFRDNMKLGSLSPLTPEQKAAEAKRQYDETLSKAASGDATAQGNVQSAATAYLTASQIINASSQEQVAIFNKVQADMSMLATRAGIQVTDTQRQLDLMNQQVSGIIKLNETAISIEQALANVVMADTTANAKQVEIDAVARLQREMQLTREEQAKANALAAATLEAVNTQTAALAQAAHDAAKKNAEEVNDGTSRTARTRNWKLDDMEYAR